MMGQVKIMEIQLETYCRVDPLNNHRITRRDLQILIHILQDGVNKLLQIVKLVKLCLIQSHLRACVYDITIIHYNA